ncbi:hypothetical protein HPB47_025489 [Ixodes persulcatus]|uniref:Uncharacterized protein n=1 Tax=Ixodes persulcatus TaxID=34615 RepID=A0AC60Q198_IXOPE|nr:hypothetical protein HPB47_025489 [Ixodes persulcatus]
MAEKGSWSPLVDATPPMGGVHLLVTVHHHGWPVAVPSVSRFFLEVGEGLGKVWFIKIGKFQSLVGTVILSEEVVAHC